LTLLLDILHRHVTTSNTGFTSDKKTKQHNHYITVNNQFILLQKEDFIPSTLKIFQEKFYILSEVPQNMILIDFSHGYCCWRYYFISL